MTHALDKDLSYAIVLPELIQAIRMLHYKEQNVFGPHATDHEIVIANGATQVIQAAISALGAKHVYASPPYFMRFPDMANMAGANFVRNYENADVEIATCPNNPDGEWLQRLGSKIPTIYDYCYNWQQYFRTGDAMKTDKDLMVFSLSKATGHASTRLGWALVKVPEVAAKMRKFIEYQTCGVSIEAQNKAYQVLIHHWVSDVNVMELGRAVMNYRWKILGDLGFQVRDGIFLWEKRAEYFAKAGVTGIGGEAFGSTNEWIRLNMGCTDDDFSEFVTRVRNFSLTETIVK